MDLQMPNINGFEALNLLRQKGVQTPVIALTAFAHKGQEQKCLESGFDAFLTKPLAKGTLIECLKRFLHDG
jgi:CheY-like chemotaxis protein